jgi:hypothetical protein
VLVLSDAIDDKIAGSGPMVCGLTLGCLLGLHIVIVAYLRGFILSYFMPVAFAGAMLTLFMSIVYVRSWSVTSGIATIGSTFMFMQFALGDYYRNHLYLDRAMAKSNTQQIEKALHFMRNYGITDRPVVWLGKVDNQGVETAIFQSLVRCGFSIDFPDKFPNGTLQWQPALEPGHLLVVMDNPKKYTSIEDALANDGIRVEQLRSETINDGLRISMGRITTVSR